MNKFELLEVGQTLNGLSPSPKKKSCSKRTRILFYTIIILVIVILFAVYNALTGIGSVVTKANNTTSFDRSNTLIVVDSKGNPLNNDAKGYTIQSSTEHGIQTFSTTEQTVPHQSAEEVSTLNVNSTLSDSGNTSNPEDCSHSVEGTSCKERTVGLSKVCYFTSWSVYRPGSSGHYTAEDIDFSLCNFILYAFVNLDKTMYTITLADSNADLPDDGGHGFIGKILSLANSTGVQVLASLGGWEESSNPAYSTLFMNDTLQNTFVQNTVAFIKQYGFHGLDFDYIYPQCPQGSCHPGNAEKLGFSNLIVKLRTEFNKHQFYLTASVYSEPDKFYEPKVLNDNLDWLAIMAYDYYTSSDPTIGLVAPLFQYGRESSTSNVKSSIELWLKRGVAANKLLLGVPLYGVSFTLADNAKYTISSPAAGAGLEGKTTLYYNEICGLESEGWTVVSSENGKPIGGTYAYKDNLWVGYDDVVDVHAKGQFILEKQLQGYMVWEMSGDDFTGSCGLGKYPLLSALSKSVGQKTFSRKTCKKKQLVCKVVS
uniref:Probable chitinase 3 n=1 Tax=Cacopsylla melanoneura TaxID=428564 RepID=A0A8D9AVH9_9HEMI